VNLRGAQGGQPRVLVCHYLPTTVASGSRRWTRFVAVCDLPTKGWFTVERVVGNREANKRNIETVQSEGYGFIAASEPWPCGGAKGTSKWLSGL
jgi:hypothetical protein